MDRVCRWAAEIASAKERWQALRGKILGFVLLGDDCGRALASQLVEEGFLFHHGSRVQ